MSAFPAWHGGDIILMSFRRHAVSPSHFHNPSLHFTFLSSFPFALSFRSLRFVASLALFPIRRPCVTPNQSPVGRSLFPCRCKVLCSRRVGYWLQGKVIAVYSRGGCGIQFRSGRCSLLLKTHDTDRNPFCQILYHICNKSRIMTFTVLLICNKTFGTMLSVLLCDPRDEALQAIINVFSF